MEPLSLETPREGAWLLIDSAPIIYTLENNPRLAPRFRPLFAAHDAGRYRFAVSTVTIAEVLSGPLQAGDEALARLSRAFRNLARRPARRRNRGKRGASESRLSPEIAGRRASRDRARPRRRRAGDARQRLFADWGVENTCLTLHGALRYLDIRRSQQFSRAAILSIETFTRYGESFPFFGLWPIHPPIYPNT